MRLVMTLLVRDAEELLEANLRFHMAQGVDHFIITDNRSTDSTADIIQRYVNEGLATAIYEAEDDYSQDRWVTRMAQLAATAQGADWVINSDDDEFWQAPGGSLKPVLSALNTDVTTLLVHRLDHPPLRTTNEGPFWQDMVYREVQSFNSLGQPLLPKMLHRAHAQVQVSQGNHDVSLQRAGLQATSREISISHFPLRTYEAFERKIRSGGAAYARNTRLPMSVGHVWRHLYCELQEGRLERWFEDRRLGAAQIDAGLKAGRLVKWDAVETVLADR